MIDLINIFTFHQIFGKNNYSLEDMRHLEVNTLLLDTHAGIVKDQNLLLDESMEDGYASRKESKLLLFHELAINDKREFELTHNNPSRPFFQETPAMSLIHQEGWKKAGLFLFQSVGPDRIDLSLDMETNQSYIGRQPARQSHKVAELRPGEMIRYRINGKNDFSLTGRRERSYSEFDSVIHWRRLEVAQLQFVNANALVEKLPLGDCKVIDERKRLY